MVQSFHSEFEDLLRGPIQVDLKGTHQLDACVFEEVIIGEPVIGEVASSYPNLMGGFGWTLVSTQLVTSARTCTHQEYGHQ